MSRAVGGGDRKGYDFLQWLSSKSGKLVKPGAVFSNLFQQAAGTEALQINLQC